MAFSVYCIENTINLKRYFGKTANIAHRWRDHKYDAGRGAQTPIHRAIRKYGAQAFTVREVARVDSEAKAFELERLMIAEWETRSHEFGYNVCHGGRGASGSRHTPESKAKFTRRGAEHPMYGKPGPMLGRRHSEETKAKISAAHRGRVASAETRQRISESMRGKPGRRLGTKQSPEAVAKTVAANRGRVLSRETRNRISVANTGKVRSPEARARYSEAAKRREAAKRGAGGE